jgi:alcohol dehydrogenase class IV
MERILQFQMSHKLVMGNGAIAELPGIIRQINGKKPLIVTDKGIVKVGLDSRIKEILKKNDIAFESFEEVEPDPKIEIVLQCLAKAKAENCDVIIGFGGGSSLDIAKVTAVLITNTGDLKSYFGIGNVPQAGIPTIMIPTTSGTGSEVTPIAILSDKNEQLKKGIVSEFLYPTYALIDPELTLSLPPHITAYTGIDALTHAIEAYTNRFAQPFIDTLALEAIRLIGANLRTAVSDGSNKPARYNMALGSLYGGLCLGSVNTAAVHALAYPLGGMFDVPHGVANSLLLPYVMEVNLESNFTKFANIASAMGEDTSGLNNKMAAQKSLDAVRKISSDTGIISHIRELGIPESAIEPMAEGAMKVTRLLNNNPKTLSIDDVRQIYKNAF